MLEILQQTASLKKYLQNYEKILKMKVQKQKEAGVLYSSENI
jgi:hypothetical protein